MRVTIRWQPVRRPGIAVAPKESSSARPAAQPSTPRKASAAPTPFASPVALAAPEPVAAPLESSSGEKKAGYLLKKGDAAGRLTKCVHIVRSDVHVHVVEQALVRAERHRAGVLQEAEARGRRSHRHAAQPSAHSMTPRRAHLSHARDVYQEGWRAGVCHCHADAPVPPPLRRSRCAMHQLLGVRDCLQNAAEWIDALKLAVSRVKAQVVFQ